MMRFTTAILSVSIVVFLVMGCAPNRSMSASVQTAPTPEHGADDDGYDAGEPIEDATIEYICPEETPKFLSDDHDEVRCAFSGPSTWNLACKIRVSHNDYYPQEFRVDELCGGEYSTETRCYFLRIDAELVPRTADVDEYALDTTTRVDTTSRADELPPVDGVREPGIPPGRPSFAEEFSLPVVILISQPIFMLYALPARARAGAYFAGVLTGSMGLYAGMIALGQPAWMRLGFGLAAVGFSALTYYNFRYASEHSASRKFWTNIAGWNAALFGSALISLAIGGLVRGFDGTMGPREDTSSGLQIHTTGSSVTAQYRF